MHSTTHECGLVSGTVSVCWWDVWTRVVLHFSIINPFFFKKKRFTYIFLQSTRAAIFFLRKFPLVTWHGPTTLETMFKSISYATELISNFKDKLLHKKHRQSRVLFFFSCEWWKIIYSVPCKNDNVHNRYKKDVSSTGPYLYHQLYSRVSIWDFTQTYYKSTSFHKLHSVLNVHV